MEERTQHRTNVPARLRFALGDKAVDVALPGDVQLIDLLPSVLSQFGKEWADQGVEHEGWIAQRVGGQPMREDQSITELNLLDGETVHLLPRNADAAALDYDDLVDGVAERIRSDSAQWSPPRTRWMLRFIAQLAFLIGLGVFVAGDEAPSLWVLPGVLGLVMLISAGAVARALKWVVDGTLIAGAGVLYTTAGAWLAAVSIAPDSGLRVWLTVGAAAAVVAIVLGVVAVADGAMLFACALVFSLFTLIAAVFWSVAGFPPVRAAAISVVVNLVASLFLPGTAFRLGRLKLPMLPTEAAEVREDIDPVPHRVVIERSALVSGYLKALYLGYGAAQAVLLVVVVRSGGKWELWTAIAVASLLVLRSRHLSGTLPRWSLLAPALVATTGVLIALAAGGDLLHRTLAFTAPMFLAGAGLVVLSGYLPGRRLRPYWGRIVDILEYAAALSVVPLLLAVLDVYSLVRGLSG
ncbi:type VII secretion integral membrane protein EccD [Lentzea sp. JNUCC 0626]|uniref:type VII secretion integral membrane protein EccD n=1 Tax=Lentzea sp. JNUCC 0626 TaxID=3367513 RepID=UPI003747D196